MAWPNQRSKILCNNSNYKQHINNNNELLLVVASDKRPAHQPQNNQETHIR